MLSRHLFTHGHGLGRDDCSRLQVTLCLCPCAVCFSEHARPGPFLHRPSQRRMRCECWLVATNSNRVGAACVHMHGECDCPINSENPCQTKTKIQNCGLPSPPGCSLEPPTQASLILDACLSQKRHRAIPLVLVAIASGHRPVGGSSGRDAAKTFCAATAGARTVPRAAWPRSPHMPDGGQVRAGQFLR